MSNRASLFMITFIALVAWGGIVLFTRFIPPNTVLAFAAVFLLLQVALTGTFTPLAYFVSRRFISERVYRITIRHSLRQGLLLGLCVVLNLILHALHSWNIVMAIVILAAAVLVEVLSLARK